MAYILYINTLCINFVRLVFILSKVVVLDIDRKARHASSDGGDVTSALTLTLGRPATQFLCHRCLKFVNFFINGIKCIFNVFLPTYFIYENVGL